MPLELALCPIFGDVAVGAMTVLLWVLRENDGGIDVAMVNERHSGSSLELEVSQCYTLAVGTGSKTYPRLLVSIKDPRGTVRGWLSTRWTGWVPQRRGIAASTQIARGHDVPVVVVRTEGPVGRS